MRLWHKDLIDVLPRLQLVSQWRECCLIAKLINEKGTPNHILVNAVMNYPVSHFLLYNYYIYKEMTNRGYKVRVSNFDMWHNIEPFFECEPDMAITEMFDHWHDDIYLRECLYNLEEKARAGGIPYDEWLRVYEKFQYFTPLWR